MNNNNKALPRATKDFRLICLEHRRRRVHLDHIATSIVEVLK